jgi:tyrosyl-tRNA synthetase
LEVFQKGGLGEDLPVVTLTRAELEAGVSVVQLFVRAGLADSGKEAKRLIADGGARINDIAVSDAGQIISAADFTTPMKLSAGKKRHAVAEIET